MTNFKEFNCYDLSENIKKPEVKYIIYVRKSTDEEWKQVQSLEDQLDECKKYIEKNNYQIDEFNENFENEAERILWLNEIKRPELKEFAKKFFVVVEKHSAKIAYKRPKWRKIIKWIKEWKIKGIISYHPDRQARNLLEAGELIDLLDNDKVDLKYSSVHFDNNTSNKMTLWILFVLAKHYSDKLSDDVTRWIISQLKQWKRKWKHKFWYYIDKNWIFKPDPTYFDIIKEAFKMRLEWKTFKKIQIFLEKSKLKKRKENDFWKLEIVKSEGFKAKTILEDSFYCWIYKYHDNKKDIYFCVDLRVIAEIGFIPAISEEDYKKIIEMWEINTKSKNKDTNEQIFSKWFIITPDWKNASSNYTTKWKNAYINFINKKYKNAKWNIPSIDDWIDEKKVRIKIFGQFAKERKKLWKKNDFSLEEIEDYLIIPALKLLNIPKLQDFFIQWEELKIFENIENEKTKRYNELKWNKLTFERMIKSRKEKLENEELSKEERKIIKDEINAYNSNLQIIHKYMWELEILSSQNKINFANFINSLSDRLIPEYKEFKVKRKKIIVESIFQNIIIDEKWLHIYCQPYYVMFFKERIKDTLILSTEIPKKIIKKKKK